MTGLRRALWVLLGTMGAAATIALLAMRVWHDGTQLTYAAGVLAFWWLLPPVALVIVAAVRRRWVVTATLLVPAVAWLWVFGPLFLPGAPAALAGEGHVRLRVVTFNISPQKKIDYVVELVQEVDADVVLLQEVLPKARKNLERELDGYPYRWYADITMQAPGGGGVGVVSRYPITDVAPIVGLPPQARPTAIVRLDVEGRDLAVVPVHLSSPCAECLWQRPSEVTHMDAPTRTRRDETPRIIEALPVDVPVVVGGDLNSSVLNEPLTAFKAAGLTDVHQAVGWGPGFTRGSERDVARIDFLLTSHEVAPLHSHVQRADGSDHRPVIADLRLGG
jgi:endonuclease/exonuclease/phosphatase (EEP) superfamily protein YafD